MAEPTYRQTYTFKRPSGTFQYETDLTDPIAAERAFDEEYKAMGTGEPIPVGAMEPPSVAAEQKTAKGIMGTALPMLIGGGAAGLAGRAALKYTGSKLAGMGAEALASGGVQVGENLLRGEPLGENVGVASALPPAGRAVGWSLGKLGRGLGRIWPGSEYAQQAAGAGEMRGLALGIDAPTTRAAGKDIQQFLQRVKGAPEVISTPTTQATLKELAEELQPLIYKLKDAGDVGMVRALSTLTAGGSLPITDLQRVLRRTGELAATRDTSLGSIWKIRKALKEDLEQAGQRVGSQARELVGRRQVYRKAKTKEEIADLARQKGFSSPTSDARVVTTHPGAVKNTLLLGQGARGEELHRRFLSDLTPDERTEIITLLNDISKLPQPGGSGFARYAGHPFAWAAGLGTLGAVGGLGGGWEQMGGAGIVAGAGAATAVRRLQELSKNPRMQRILNSLIQNELGRGPLAGAVGAGFGRINQGE